MLIKVTTITRLKCKLENHIDELDGQLEVEKKVRLDLERGKRKVELDLRMASETIIDLENDKSNLEESLSKGLGLYLLD